MNFCCRVCSVALAFGRVAAATAHAQAPVLISPPQPATAFLGSPAWFSVSVGSPGSIPSFQWPLLGTGPLPGSFTSVLGVSNASLSISTVSINHVGQYFVICRNASGSVTSTPAARTVLSPPLRTLRLGEVATPDTGSTMQWIDNGPPKTESTLPPPATACITSWEFVDFYPFLA